MLMNIILLDSIVINTKYDVFKSYIYSHIYVSYHYTIINKVK